MLKDIDSKLYPRDMVGYGQKSFNPKWPNNARLAVQFVLNYEEGGENCVLHGDKASEAFLSEIVSAKSYDGMRHMSMESIFEYGSRVGCWRIINLFKEFNIPITIFAVGLALTRNLEVANYLKNNNYDVCAHGFKWIDYQFIDKQTERTHIAECIKIFEKLLGRKPDGWYTGRTSPNTRDLIIEEGIFNYDSDDYSDDLPFWIKGKNNNEHLIIPYTLDTNDMRFTSVQGFNSGEQFFNYLKDSFDALYLEGKNSPKMMSVGMHGRILGRPGRIMAMRRFLEYISQFDDVWLCERRQIAEHWYKNFSNNK